MKSEKKSPRRKSYALAFGLFLGLAFWKFGNPVILDHKIIPPVHACRILERRLADALGQLDFLPLAGRRRRDSGLRQKLPLAGDKMALAAAVAVVWLAACFRNTNCGCRFDGGDALAIFRLRGVLFSRRAVLDSERAAALAVGRRAGGVCVLPHARGGPAAFGISAKPPDAGGRRTRRLDERTAGNAAGNETRACPSSPPTAWMWRIPPSSPKFAKGRVMGTLVYPNALAGTVLLLLPVALTLAFGAKKLRPAIRAVVIALTCFLGGAGFFWTGSKLGWLIAMALGGLYLFRLNWPAKFKIAALAAVVILGLGIFAVRFHNYFAAGATSAGARLDYWRAAVQTTAKNPLAGTGPGTFPAALRATQIAGRRDGPAHAQRLPRTIFGFGNSRRDFLSALDCSGAAADWTRSDVWNLRGRADRVPVCHFHRTARLVCPGHRRIQPLHSGAGLDGLHAAGLLAGD